MVYRVKCHSNFDYIDRLAWDEIASDNVLAYSGWLKTIEDCYLENEVPLYLCIHRGQDLAAIAICYFFGKNCGSVLPERVVLGRLLKSACRLGFDMKPLLSCQQLFGTGMAFYIHKEHKDAESELRNHLISAIENEAAKRRSGVVFGKINAQEKAALSCLKSRGYLHFQDSPYCYMDIKWKSFEEYLRYIRETRGMNAYRNILRDRNKSRKSGVKIKKLTRPSTFGLRVLELLKANHRKYSDERFRFKHDFLTKLFDNFSEHTLLLASFNEDRIEAVKLELMANGISFAPLIGVDHILSVNNLVYFEISYYFRIAQAIENKSKRIYGGNGLHKTKYRRGYDMMKTYYFYSPQSSSLKWVFGLWAKLHSYWIKRKYAQFFYD